MIRPETGRTGGNSEETELLAISILGFLGADEDRLMRFLALTGLGLDELRDRAGEPSFLAGIFDYLLADEPLLLAFAEAEGMKPEAVVRMRRRLPGLWEE